jgi:site-specific recombinase XerD
MSEDLFKEPVAAERLGRDPLEAHIDSFARSLVDLGYSSSTVRTSLWCLADFSGWIQRRDVAVGDLDDRIIDVFVDERQRHGRLHRSHRPAVRRLVEYLREQGIVRAPTPERPSAPLPGAWLLRQYEEHLRAERGLAPASVVAYLSYVRRFVDERFGEQPLRLRELGPRDVSSFIVRYAHSMSPGTAKLMVTALRSFLRFLFQRGQLEVNLAEAVPRVADWRLSTIPRYLSVEETEDLLDACDQSTGTGRRNYSILVLLARLGLRAGEVVALELDDIDWRAGEIVVRGKGLLHDRLPLLPEVGEALAAYLRWDRPLVSTRRVFVCMRAPLRGFAGASTVSTIVRRALERAGLNPPKKGAHVLRHSLATGMLQSGASMAEIGEILRHRSPNTTEIYAKVDFAGLSLLAQPWPVAGGGR